MSRQTNERVFETHVEETLAKGGWQSGTNGEWDVECALSPFRICAFLQETQPKLWAQMRTLQVFTLAHELAHVWHGQSAVSDTEARTAVPDHAIERWCNEVAAELLVPLESLRGALEHLPALPAGGGGNFYLTIGARARKTFARALVVSTLGGRTPFTEAFRMLGFKKMATLKEMEHSFGVGA
jgi:hypothetical protein